MPIRPLESGTSTADSRIVGFGGAFGHPAAGRQRAERRAKCIILIAYRPLWRDTEAICYPVAKGQKLDGTIRLAIPRRSMPPGSVHQNARAIATLNVGPEQDQVG